MATKQGMSLHIGLNYVDPEHYDDWNGELSAAEKDAEDMFSIAQSQGLVPLKLLRAEATRDAVISEISNAAKKLKKNDLFVITYSGHGGQIPDINSDEEDQMDETWCLYDGELLDDELSALWLTFSKGVHIFVISDSCHSGTVTKAMITGENKSKATPKYMPVKVANATYSKNKQFYDGLKKKVKGASSNEIAASVKLISGCQDDQYSYDGPSNGQFTGKLRKVWKDGKFKGNHYDFYRKIKKSMPSEQKPNYFNVGKSSPTFNKQKPFSFQ